jgi:membrane protease YdiL (CAAX protease family)
MPTPAPHETDGTGGTGRPGFPARVRSDVVAAVVSAAIAVLLPVLLLVVSVLLGGSGGDPLGSTAGLLRQALGDGVVLVVLVVVVSVLGGWRPVLAEPARARSWWGVGVLVVFTAVTLVAFTTPLRTDAGGYLGALLVGLLAVALVEELVFRGVLVAGFRRVAPEWVVWLVATATFALAHALNADGTAFQVLTTFLLGSACYLARRVTGSLLGAVLFHLLYDAFLGFRSQTVDGMPFLLNAASTLAVAVAAVVGFVVALRTPAPGRGSGTGTSA